MLCDDCKHEIRVKIDGLLVRLSGHEKKKAVHTDDLKRIKAMVDATLDLRNLLLGDGPPPTPTTAPGNKGGCGCKRKGDGHGD